MVERRQLREVKVRDLIRMIESDGWKHVRTTGSHRHFKAIGTLKLILRSAGLEEKGNIREAIQGHLETLRQSGDPIPEPSSLAGEVEVSTAA